MRQHDFSIFYDGPTCQYRIAEVTAGLEAEDGGIVHVPHAECVGYTPGSFLIHLLKQDHIGVSQSLIACEPRNGVVNPERVLDVEGDSPQRGSVLFSGGNRRSSRVTRTIWIGVVPSG